MKNVCPTKGGCWYCHTDEGEMYFSGEFDTYIHLECIREVALINDPNDLENRILVREFQEELKEIGYQC